MTLLCIIKLLKDKELKFMKDVIRKTLYLSKENNNNLRKASYLANTSQSIIINNLLDEVLKNYIKELEQNENE